MKRGVFILGFLLAITIAGGLLTANLGFGIPLIRQSTDPAASAFMATNDQALLFMAWVGFVIFNIIGAGLTLAFVFWLLSKQVKIANEMPTLEERREREALPEATS